MNSSEKMTLTHTDMPEGTATVLTDMAELVDEKEKARAFGQLQLQHLETVFKSKAVRQFIEGIEDWEDNLSERYAIFPHECC